MRLPVVLLCACGLLTAQYAAGTDAPAAVPRLAILQPQHDEVIHDNTGAVPVSVMLEGAKLAPGSRLRVLLDGTPHGTSRDQLVFTLEGIERGTHNLQVQLIDAGDRLSATSPMITFHLWQASRLMPPRGPPPN